ncbi:MAG: CAAX prenyl protease-related protein [Pirellulaceae bacterium]|nr:CAAX prenyl protease-related protein [Pirellulaceae bacterium]
MDSTTPENHLGNTNTDRENAQSDKVSNRLAVALIAPLAIYMALGFLSPAPILDKPSGEPAPNSSSAPKTGQGQKSPATAKEPPLFYTFPFFYAIRIGLTLSCIGYFWRAYRPFFPLFRPDFLAISWGCLGAGIWIGLCNLRLEPLILSTIGLDDQWLGSGRSFYNPFPELGETSLLFPFLALRFFGLALVIPFVEELFVRGFLGRYISTPNWQQLPLRKTTLGGLAAITIYGVLTHPHEAIAAAIWFSFLSFLMLKRDKLSSCFQAHAVTNLLLGLWVLYSHQWHLW